MSLPNEATNTVDGTAASAPCCHGHSSDHTHSDSHAEARAAASAPQKPLNGAERTVYLIAQMDCPTEEALIRKRLSSMPSVQNVQFNLMQRLLTVDHSPLQREAIAQAIRSLGFTAELPEAVAQSETAAAAVAGKRAHWPLALSCAAAVASEIASFAAFPGWIAASLAVLAIIAGGLGTYKKGWVAIRNGNLNINALMSIAVTGALFLGQWPEASMVMVLFSLAELIEAKSLDRARNAVQKLMQLAPERATVQQPNGT